MSFTRFLYPDPLHTRQWYMGLFIEVANELGLPEKAAAVLAGMCCFQEAGVTNDDPPKERRIWLPANPTHEPSSVPFDHDSESNDGRSVGICQQQRGPNGELWWGTVADEMNPRTAIRTFMSRLPKGFHANDAEAANNFVQAVQRSGVPHAYAQWWGDAIRLYNEVKAGAPVTVPPPAPVWTDVRGPWTGDPIWLADVLRREGVTVVETTLNGASWLESGHGDMGSLWGVVCHHTGNSNSTWESIRIGRPDLRGPLAQIHLRRDGVAELVAVGVCWHAGTGGAPGLPLHSGNQKCIGIEAQNSGSEGWSPAQYDAYVKICAAFCRRIGVDASHVVSHEEYDSFDPATDEGKWDPGLLDMPRFRKDVQARIDSKFNPPEEDDDMGLNDVAASWSAFRGLDEKPHMTIKEFILSIDGMTHMHHTVLWAAIGDPHHLQLLKILAEADVSQHPERAGDQKLAQLALDAIDAGTFDAAKALADAVAKLPQPTPSVPNVGPVPAAPLPVADAAKVCALGDGKACVVDGSTTRCAITDDGVCAAQPKE